MAFRFQGKLPKGFVISKPIAPESYDASLLTKLDSQKRLIKTRKRDGWKILIATDRERKVRIYTDGINEIDRRLDHIRKEVQLLELPTCSLLIGEAVIDIHSGDDIGKVISVFHSSEERSIALQKEIGKMKCMIFGLVFLDGKQVTISYTENLAYFQNAINSKRLSFVFPVPILTCSLAEAQKTAVDQNWEGLVLYDKNFAYTFRTDGKNPQRPKGCYKWKPIFEDDFIVRENIMRPGNTEVKELILLQKDPSTKQEFYCGKLGSFTEQLRKQLARIKYPFVVQAAFEMRFPKTGKIRNARFVRVRADKKIGDCVAPKSYSSSEIA